jgi:hypothetical protein
VTARVVDGWSHRGLEACIIENAALRVTILPELGGHVFELIDKRADRDLLWHNPRTFPRRAPFGVPFDDWWSGGWDEIFPTGDVAAVRGETLPYMGELWSVPWTCTPHATAGEAAVALAGFGTITPARMEKRLSLRGDEPVLRVSYRLTNLDHRPLDFLWGIHPALAVAEGYRIDVPATRMLVGSSSGPALGATGDAYEWPWIPLAAAPGGRRDARLVPGPNALVFGGHWATDLREGWLALTDPSARRGLALAFPREVFPVAWLWQVYGGWRGHHHLALEPWTGHPMQLADALAAGRARTLAPGANLEAEVAFIVHEGLAEVAAVERDRDSYRVG